MKARECIYSKFRRGKGEIEWRSNSLVLVNQMEGRRRLDDY